MQRLHFLIPILLAGFLRLVLLTACTAITTRPMPQTQTSIVPFTHSSALDSTPINPRTVVPTPLPRWAEYEDALVNAFFPGPYYLLEKGLCEWTILGKGPSEVYVIAACQEASSFWGLMRAPAVIRIGEDGKIKEVLVPGPGGLYGADMKRLFPPEIQARISAHEYLDPDIEYLEKRRGTHNPPLIVVLGTPLP
jgi:hypothetical protein